MLVPRFHTAQVNSEVPSRDWVVVERGLQGVHYHPLSHDHLLAFDQVDGAWGFFGLQTHVCGVKHPKGNENGIFYAGATCNYRDGVELSQRRRPT